MSTIEQTQAEFEQLASKLKAGLMERAICIQVTLRRPGKSKKVASNVHVAERLEAEGLEGVLFEGAPLSDGATQIVPVVNPAVHTDITQLRISKLVLDCPELKEIEQYDGRIRRYMQTKALPSMFSAGAYLTAIADVPEVVHILRNYETGRKPLVATFLACYEAIKAAQKAKLGDLYDERDYPPVEVVARAFSMSFHLVSYGVPEKVKEISKELYAVEERKAMERCIAASEEIQAALRVSFAELVNSAVAKLTGSEDGKKKSFNPKKLSKLRDFVGTFKNRNVSDDAEMEQLVTKAQALLDGVDPETLKSDQDYRDRLRQGFEEVKATLDSMVEVTSERKFRLDLDEEVDDVVTEHASDDGLELTDPTHIVAGADQQAEAV
ncbi:MAG: hypothetical protein HY646_06000 [Acidobacteria bacterium]|nr:hypothetical protein [Acidobacteriota bacterium]